MTGKISSIQRQKGDKRRASIFIDEQFAFGIESETIEEFRLRKGDFIDEDLFGKLLDFDLWIGAKRIALRFVNHRARSEREIRARLIREEIPTEIVDRTIEFLKGFNLIDDARFAKAFINDKLIRKQLSSSMLGRELARLGVAPAFVDEAIGELLRAESDNARALKAAEMRLPRLSGETPDSRKRKLYSYLALRGFSREIIESVLRSVLSSTGQPDDST